MSACNHHNNEITKTDTWACGFVRGFGDTKKTWQCHHSLVCRDCGRILKLGVSSSQCPEFAAAHSA